MTRVGAAIVLVVIVAALFGPMVAPFDPSTQQMALRLEGPTGLHWFGLDELGRDIFTRVLYGARISLLVGLVVVGVSATMGITLGAIAGYFGGRVDMIVTFIIAPILLIGLMRLGESETHQWLAEESDAHRRWLEEWRSGGFPGDASGQRIKALAERVRPDQAALIRDYCILMADLVLAAEEELLDRDRRLEDGQAERLREAFARLAEIRQAIGRVGYAALRRQLPFSRNDDWELSELKELIDRD